MSRRGLLLFVAMSVIWGTPYLLIKVAVDELSPATVVFARTTIGAMVLLPLALRRRQLGALRGRWRWLLAFAVLEIIGPWLLLSDAERTLTSSTTGLLIATVPAIGVMIGWLVRDGQRLTLVRSAGLLLGFGGVALLAAPTLDTGGWWPVIEVLLVAVGYASAPFIADRALHGVPGLAMTGMALALAALVYAPAAAVTRPAAVPSGRALLALAGLGAVCTALAFVLFVELIREIGPGRATVITYLNPAVAVALGVALLGEPLNLLVGAAFVLILFGSVLATRVSGPQRRDRPPVEQDRRPAAAEV